MTNKPVKVLVTGGAGQIGYALLFRIASGQMFGPNTPVELSLLELEAALPAAQGVKMELIDCAFPLLKAVHISSDLNEACKDVNWALLVGAVPRKAGMERSDLLKINGGIFGPQGKALNDHAASDVRVLVVGNPCNTNCLIAMNHAPDIPNDRFFAMTMLDESRARGQLALKAGVDVAAVTDMAIWGNHSATQYPDAYHAKINGEAADKVINDENWLHNDFLSTVQQRGAAIIQARGASSAASAANAVVDTVYNIVHPTAMFSVASCANGEYGVDPGLIFSFPTRSDGNTVSIIEGLEHNAYSQAKIQATLDELRAERDAVTSL